MDKQGIKKVCLEVESILSNQNKLWKSKVLDYDYDRYDLLTNSFQLNSLSNWDMVCQDNTNLILIAVSIRHCELYYSTVTIYSMQFHNVEY